MRERHHWSRYVMTAKLHNVLREVQKNISNKNVQNLIGLANAETEHGLTLRYNVNLWRQSLQRRRDSRYVYRSTYL